MTKEFIYNILKREGKEPYYIGDILLLGENIYILSDDYFNKNIKHFEICNIRKMTDRQVIDDRYDIYKGTISSEIELEGVVLNYL
jgi:hypothetical protein